MAHSRLLSHSEAETLALAQRLAAKLRPGDAVLLYGDLGAGKTVFARGLVSHFAAAVGVSSPTFTLVNVYPTTPQVVHFDLYRVAGESDLLDLGLQEYYESGAIVVIEWAERCGTILPPRYFRVDLQIANESEREIRIEEVLHAAARN